MMVINKLKTILLQKIESKMKFVGDVLVKYSKHTCSITLYLLV